MRMNFKISTVALLAAMLTTLPATAAVINLGGNGSNGGIVNLGGNGGSNTNAVVDTGNLLGTNGNNPNGVVTTDLLGTGSDPTTANVNLGGTGNNATLLDLFGTGNTDPTTANVNLGGAGNGTTGNAVLDLFGTDGSTNPGANVSLGSPSNAVSTGDTGRRVDLFGTDGSDGANGANGTDGSNGSNGLGFGNGGSSTTTISTGGRRIASVDTRAGACFAPNAQQIAKLSSRHVYEPATFGTWSGATSIKIIDAGICDSAASSLSSQPNIDHLQAYVDSNAALKAGLDKAGHKPGDVVAVDRSGSDLVVYVM